MVKSRAFPVFAVIALILSAALESPAYPAIELKYDDGESDTLYNLYVDKEGWVAYAVEFYPPQLPWVLTAVRICYVRGGFGKEILRVEIWDPKLRTYFTYNVTFDKDGCLIKDVPDVMINFTPFYLVVLLERWEGGWLRPSIGADCDTPAGRSYKASVVGGNVLQEKLKCNLMIGAVGTSLDAYAGESLTPVVLGRVEYLQLALAFLGLLALISLAAAVRASRRVSRLESQLWLLEERLRFAELAPRRAGARVEEAGRERVEAPKLGAGARVPGVSGWVVVIDGSNVAYAARDSLGRPRAKNILLAVNWARERGCTPLVVVDASLKHHIDDPATLSSLRARGILYEAPARTSADAFIISIAEKQGALILSNDTFKEYLSEKPWIEKRRLAFMIVGDEIFVIPPGEREQKGGEEKR
ncbi:MAG: hypothetical protein QXH65_07570 [Thermofilaceae archaeon]